MPVSQVLVYNIVTIVTVIGTFLIIQMNRVSFVKIGYVYPTNINVKRDNVSDWNGFVMENGIVQMHLMKKL
jgi:hypothetical protein